MCLSDLYSSDLIFLEVEASHIIVLHLADNRLKHRKLVLSLLVLLITHYLG